jgi:hypothetical protein
MGLLLVGFGSAGWNGCVIGSFVTFATTLLASAKLDLFTPKLIAMATSALRLGQRVTLGAVAPVLPRRIASWMADDAAIARRGMSAQHLCRGGRAPGSNFPLTKWTAGGNS